MYVFLAGRGKDPKDRLYEFCNSLYNKKVFLAPPWKEIYCNDTEIKQSFEEALEVYDHLFKIYSDFGYEVIELPKTSVESRADFVISHMKILHFR
ncbi:MAG: AAA family ATPase [Parachlamydiaceae bacterium]|nr:AAA family ATPase [Parachlamydiaceae bacterium]